MLLSGSTHRRQGIERQGSVRYEPPVKWILLMGACAMGCFGLGCGGKEEEELPDVDCAAVVVPTFSEVTAFAKCTSCHSSQLMDSVSRRDAPVGWNFDTYAGAAQDPTKVVHEVYEGEMPPADSGITLTEAEKQQIYNWGLCGNPM